MLCKTRIITNVNEVGPCFTESQTFCAVLVPRTNNKVPSSLGKAGAAGGTCRLPASPQPARAPPAGGSPVRGSPCPARGHGRAPPPAPGLRAARRLAERAFNAEEAPPPPWPVLRADRQTRPALLAPQPSLGPARSDWPTRLPITAQACAAQRSRLPIARRGMIGPLDCQSAARPSLPVR